MVHDDSGGHARKARSGPEVVAPTNRVNVALPFGNIHIEQSSKELAELAALVVELVSIVEVLAPGPTVEKLREKAQALAARVG